MVTFVRFKWRVDSTDCGGAIKRRRTRSAHPQRRAEEFVRAWRPNNFSLSDCPQLLHVTCTGFQQVQYRSTPMRLMIAGLTALLLAAVPSAVHAAGGATLFRLFLRDGTSVVSFGEFARLEDEVVFSMPVGGPADEPRVQVVSLPSSEIDWTRTDRYAASVRYQQYADTRGEEDFQLLSSDIARVLNEIALSNDKEHALSSAEQARRTLASWPAAHYGYRQRDVREVVSLLDEAISDLKASSGLNDFSLSLVATPEETGSEPLLPAPTLREEIDQTF